MTISLNAWQLIVLALLVLIVVFTVRVTRQARISADEALVKQARADQVVVSGEALFRLTQTIAEANRLYAAAAAAAEIYNIEEGRRIQYQVSGAGFVASAPPFPNTLGQAPVTYRGEAQVVPADTKAVEFFHAPHRTYRR